MAEHLIEIEEAQNNLLDCAAYLAENIRSRDGYGEAMSEIVPRYLRKSAVDLAAQLADAIEDPFVRDKNLIETAATCAALGDDEYALQLAESIEDYGLQSQARERIALAKAAGGDFEKAVEIASTLDHADNALAAIVAHKIALDDESGALLIVEQIVFPEAKIHALQEIAHFYLKKGDAAKTSEMLEQAAKAADETEFPEEKIRALSDTANYFIEAERRDRAIELFDRAKSIAERNDSVNRDGFLAEIALGFLRAGSLELADRTLDLATDKTQIATALHGFAQTFRARGEQDEALETLEESYSILKSQRDREVRSSPARFGLFAQIAVEFARMEKAERAIEIAQEIADETEKMSALAQIAQICAARGEDELMRLALAATGEDSQRMFALISVSDANKNAGKQAQAIEILREAAHLAETVSRLSLRSQAFNELAKRFADFGETETAREISLENLRTIEQIRDETIRVVALARLSDVYEQSNFSLTDVEKAILQLLVKRAEF